MFWPMRFTGPSALAALLVGFSLIVISEHARADLAEIDAFRDNFIINQAGLQDNNAGGTFFFVSGTNRLGDPRRGLIGFDLTIIDPGSTILDVTLRMEVVGVPNMGSQNSNFGVHQLTRDWGEGNKSGNNGSPASDGESTWNSARHNQELWSNPGADGDFDATPSASTFITGLGVYNWTGDALIADVQAMVDDPDSNFGWLVMSAREDLSGSGRRWGAREDPTDTVAHLTVEVDAAVPEPSTTTATCLLLFGAIAWRMRRAAFMFATRKRQDKK